MRRGAAVAVLALLLAAGCTSHRHSTARTTRPSTLFPSSTPTPAQGGTAVARGSLSSAELHVSSGFGSVQIVAADTGADLVEASGPADATSTPVLTVGGGQVTITQPQGGPSLTLLMVRLSKSVAWQVDLDGGASTTRLDLRAATVRGVQVTQGVSSLTMTLPAPAGTLPIDVNAGASTVHISVVGGAPVRAALNGGASTVTLYGATHTGIAGGTQFTSNGWSAARDRLDVSCSAGVSVLVVDSA